MAHKQGCPFGVDKAAFFSCTCRHPMTDIPEELVEEVRCIIMEAVCEQVTTRGASLDAIRAVLDWQAKEWVEIPRLDRP